jgi:hypothetical protein
VLDDVTSNICPTFAVCHNSQETRVQTASDDLTSTICQALGGGRSPTPSRGWGILRSSR